MRSRGSVCLPAILLCTGILSVATAATAADVAAPGSSPATLGIDTAAKIAPWVKEHVASGVSDSFIVLFDAPDRLHAALRGAEGSARPAAAVYDTLRGRSRSRQGAVRAWLTSLGVPWRSLYVVNGLRVEGDLDLARRIAAFPEVVRIIGDPAVRGIDPIPATFAPASLPYGITTIHADQVWTQDGVRGAGIVVASADTGVEWNHPALIGKYRGWNGTTASHDYNWHDSIQDLAVPLDDHGHGTHTVGTMVGDDGGANQIGVAPDAKWIGCRNMDHGVGRPSTYLECIQYFLAPWPHGGDPEADGDPSRSPDIINNSWGCPTSEGCDPGTLSDAFASLEAAGIMAVAAAGNSGSSCSSVTDPPGIYGDVLVAGATDSNNTVAQFSSRGPVTVDGSNRLRPDLAAPGVDVYSSVTGGGYTTMSGTSMASPHTSGAAALLWSARPQLKNAVRVSRCVMMRSTNPAVGVSSLGSCGGTTRYDIPNNFFGYGLLDAYAAIHYGPDRDGDGVADTCDCASRNGDAFDAPFEVSDLGFDADRITLHWDSQSRLAGSGTVYDVLRGDLAQLRTDGSIAAAACLASGVASASYADAAAPGVDEGRYYLTQARNRCGIGGYGTDSTGATRTHAACP